jgi:putative transposase
MLKAYKYRIYPTDSQKEFFAKNFGCARLIWNVMLSERIDAYKKKEDPPPAHANRYKQQFPFLKEIDSQALGNVYLQLQKAFRDHSRNKKHFGFPKFKKKKDSKQSYTTNVRIENNRLKVPKLKSWIKIKLHRQFTGTIKSVTISKTPSDKYFASILVDTPEVRNKIVEPISKKSGIDVGIAVFTSITDDFGSIKTEHPHYLKKAEKKLIKLQRRLSRKKIGSSNREKARLSLAKYHEYVSNIRHDFLHKLSKTIIDENQVIVVEDLNVKSMLKNRYLAKSVSDSSWSTFITYLEYKANWYGRTLIKADRYFPSSKMCSKCGYINKDFKLVR